MNDEKLYKCLDLNGVGMYSGCCWHLPKNGKPGKWMPAVKGWLELCQRGYHLAKADQLWPWLAGPELYEAEGRGDSVRGSDKTAFRQARLVRRVETWNRRTARLLACDIAEALLPLYTGAFLDNVKGLDLLGRGIDVARQLAEGKPVGEEFTKIFRKIASMKGAMTNSGIAAVLACGRINPFQAYMDARLEAQWAQPREGFHDLGSYITERLFSYLYPGEEVESEDTEKI